MGKIAANQERTISNYIAAEYQEQVKEAVKHWQGWPMYCRNPEKVMKG